MPPEDTARGSTGSVSESTRKTADGRRWCARVGRHFAFAFAFVIVPGALDCFGLESRTDRFSRDMVVQAAAPWYATGSDGFAHEAAGASAGVIAEDWGLTVVILDEVFLDHVGQAWPLPYGEYARLTRRIASHEPAAIFLDLIFSQYRESDATLGALRAVIEHTESSGIPVFVAAPNPCLTAPPHARRRELLRGGSEPGRGLSSWTGRATGTATRSPSTCRRSALRSTARGARAATPSGRRPRWPSSSSAVGAARHPVRRRASTRPGSASHVSGNR